MSSSGYFRADNKTLRELYMNKDLHVRERLLFYLMANEDHTKAYTCRKTRKQIAEAMGCTVRNLINLINSFVEAGVIEIVPNNKSRPTRCLFRVEIVQQRRALSGPIDEENLHLSGNEWVKKNDTYRVKKNDTYAVSREDKLEDNNSPISPLTLKNSHPNPPSKEEGSFEGMGYEELLNLALENMGLSEKEYMDKKTAGMLTKYQLNVERAFKRGRVMFNGKMRRIPGFSGGRDE